MSTPPIVHKDRYPPLCLFNFWCIRLTRRPGEGRDDGGACCAASAPTSIMHTAVDRSLVPQPQRKPLLFSMSRGASPPATSVVDKVIAELVRAVGRGRHGALQRGRCGRMATSRAETHLGNR